MVLVIVRACLPRVYFERVIVHRFCVQASVPKTQNSSSGPLTWRFTMKKYETSWEATPNRDWRLVPVVSTNRSTLCFGGNNYENFLSECTNVFYVWCKLLGMKVAMVT